MAVFVRTTLPSGDVRAFELTQQIGRLIEAGGFQRLDPTFRYSFTGNLITSAEQYRAISGDLISIGVTGIALVLVVVFLFFLRKRALLALGLAIVIGCAWSLCFAWLTVGHLNTATGFLISIIAGNGINAMVIWMARYLEARRTQGMNVRQAGMLFRWIAAYTVLPALLLLSERVAPLDLRTRRSDRLAALYGRPFAWLAKRHSVFVACFGGVVGIAAAIGSSLYFIEDPMEYYLSRVLNRETTPTSAGRVSSRVNQVAGRLSQGGRALLVDRLEQVEPVVQELERRRDSAAPARKPFGDVVSIFSLLPRDQPQKLKLLSEIADRAERARRRGLIPEDQWREIEPHLRTELRPICRRPLPAPFKRRAGNAARSSMWRQPTGEA